MALIGCLGAGTVGRAWAVVFARAGFDVKLFDIAMDDIKGRTFSSIEATLDLLENAGVLAEDSSRVIARIEPVHSIQECVESAVHVQESVREDVDTKRAVFEEAAQAAPSDCILASSTSAIPGSDFLSDIVRPERAVVAHPVNPPSLIPLVELCPTRQTSEQTVHKTKTLMSDIGMQPVTLNKEIDGFILNRLQYTLVAEAMHLVGEGYCSADDIDRVMTHGLALRWASIGPFEVAHLNAEKGFQGFVEQLGPMMKNMGRSARTDYDWDSSLAHEIHASLEQRVPVSEIPERQKWRDGRILATRALQAGKVNIG